MLYFVSYNYDNKTYHGSGNCALDLSHPVRDFKDIEYIEEIILENIKMPKDTNIIVMNFQRFDK